jgi:hypothetical protein
VQKRSPCMQVAGGAVDNGRRIVRADHAAGTALHVGRHGVRLRHVARGHARELGQPAPYEDVIGASVILRLLECAASE